MGDAGLHPCGILFLTGFFQTERCSRGGGLERFFCLVCVLSALFQRNYEFRDLKSIDFRDSAGHLLINCPFGMKNFLFKLLQENFLSTEKSPVWLF